MLNGTYFVGRDLDGPGSRGTGEVVSRAGERAGLRGDGRGEPEAVEQLRREQDEKEEQTLSKDPVCVRPDFFRIH